MNLPIFFQSLTLIIAPLYILRAELKIPFLSSIVPTTLLEVILLASILLTATDFFKNRINIGVFKTSFDKFILLFLISIIISVIVSVDQKGGLGILKAYFVEPILFYYCLIYQSRKHGAGFIKNSLIISAVSLSALGLLQKVSGGFTLAPYELAQGRVTAVYNSANSLSLFLAPITFIVLANFFSAKNLYKKALFLATVSFLILVITWTKSRGGFISELLSLGVYLYVYLNLKITKLRKYWYVLPILLTIWFFSYLFYTFETKNFLPADYGRPYTDGDTLQIRYFIWAGTINLLKDHPVFGAGLNGFKTLYSNQYRLQQFQEQFQYPHNLLLTYWTETGLLGLTAFVILIVKVFSVVIRNMIKIMDSNSNSNFHLGLSFLAIFTYWLVHGFVDVPYFKNDLSLEFWTIVALVEIWRVNLKIKANN